MPLSSPEDTWFIDGSMNTGQHRAGCAIVSSTQVVEANPLPPETSSPRAELIALIPALSLAKDRKIDTYTDSKYAYHILHSHAYIWAGRGFLTSGGSPVTNADLISKLPLAALLPFSKLLK